LRLLYFSDFFVDAVSPEPLLARRRSSILDSLQGTLQEVRFQHFLAERLSQLLDFPL